MLFKKSLIALAVSTLAFCAYSAPTSPEAETNKTILVQPVQANLYDRNKLTIELSSPKKISPQRVLVFGDSLSDIGNVQLLLETLKGEQSATLLFKPLNENQFFQKLLTYLHIPMNAVEDAEKFSAGLLIHLMNILVNFPVYPNEHYYSGPTGHKSFARFTNGPVWSEWLGQAVLQDKIGNKQTYINRAYGGSWASGLWDQKINWTLNLYNLESSILDAIYGKLIPPNFHFLLDGFFMEYPSSSGGEVITILYGENDYLNNDYSKPESKENQRTHPETVITDLKKEIIRLANWAARGSAPSVFYIPNLPDISKAPRYQNGDKTGQGAAVLEAIKAHNVLLKQLVTSFSANPAYKDKVLFRHVELYDWFNQLYDTSPIPNKTVACYPIDLLAEKLTIKTFRSILSTSDVEPCNNPDDYFFWDTVHPTRQIHAELSFRICQEVSKDIEDVHCQKPDWKDESTYPVPAFNP